MNSYDNGGVSVPDHKFTLDLVSPNGGILIDLANLLISAGVWVLVEADLCVGQNLNILILVLNFVS